MNAYRPRVVVLTGAGISAESGIPTFRASDGLWHNHRIEDVASPAGYARNPGLVHEFYDMRRREVAQAEPNAAHDALATLDDWFAGRGDDDGVVIITQNIDDLHERAGSRRVIHLHGELTSAACTQCGERLRWTEDLGDRPACQACGARALRPDIVWFGEPVRHYDDVLAAVSVAEVLIVIGTSGTVHPAAGFVEFARGRARETILVNLEVYEDVSAFSIVREGPATREVPLLVAEMMTWEWD